MANTYMARFNGTGVAGEVILGIYNQSSTKVAKIYRAFCSPTGIIIAATGKWFVKTISAISAGDDVPTSDIQKMDTSDSNLPSQVVIKTNAITTAVSQITPNRPGIMTLNNAANARLFSCVSGPSWPNHNYGSLVPSAGINSSVQGFILREGQGIAIDMQNADYITQPRDFHVILRDISSGAIYNVYVNDENQSEGSKSALAILNGSGSGVVLEVLEVAMYLNGANLSGRQIFGKLNKRIDIGGACEVIPVKMDSTSPDMPGDIKVYNHALFDPKPDKFGFAIQPYIASSVMYETMQRYSTLNGYLSFVPSSIGKGPDRSVGGLGGLTNTHVVCAMFDATRNGNPIIVNESDMVGFYVPPWFGGVIGQRFEYTLEFTIEDIPTPPSGSTAAPRPYYGLGYG